VAAIWRHGVLSDAPRPCFLFAHPKDVQTILRDENFAGRRSSRWCLAKACLSVKASLEVAAACHAGRLSSAQRRATGSGDGARSGQNRGRLADGGCSRPRRRRLHRYDAADNAGHRQSLFSDDLSDTEAGELCAAVALAITEQGKLSWLVFGIPAHFTPESAANITASKAVLDEVAYEMIRRRRSAASCDRPPDLLTLLIEPIPRATDERAADP